ncbi:MAG TPA: SDR family NAD(P)-dependent oxidoreductase, partial [Rhizobiaceae bacterium]|nr:SDR family NAD(P)-dependent oxidoreductase [Rhizobiaceae bacterium]
MTAMQVLVIGAGVALFSHVVFRFFRLYATAWRFASTQDFFNILRSCGVIALALYFVVLLTKEIKPFIGLNEREFLVFFQVMFVLVSGPRLLFRYLRDGNTWHSILTGFKDGGGRRAIFAGHAVDTEYVVHFLKAHEREGVDIVGIVTDDAHATPGRLVSGIPILGEFAAFGRIVDELFGNALAPEMLIIGPNRDEIHEGLVNVIRMARKRGLDVRQLAGLADLQHGPKLSLEKVDMESLFKRSTVSIPATELATICRGNRILVTGGGGTIGGHLALRALELGAARVQILDRNESAVFAMHQKLDPRDADRFDSRIIDICRKEQVIEAMAEFRPDIVFHAAALKHVPYLERDWVGAIDVNVFGTENCVEAAKACG